MVCECMVYVCGVCMCVCVCVKHSPKHQIFLSSLCGDHFISGSCAM